MRVPQTLFVLIQVASLVKSVTWTLHLSCYENPALKSQMIAAVSDAVKQAALAAEKLRKASYLPPIPGGPQPDEDARRVREVADFFLAPIPNDKVDDMIAHYEKVAQLGDPVGADGNFADGPTWQSQRSSDQNYLNFVVACAPDLIETTDHLMVTRSYDRLRENVITHDDCLVMMQNDIKKGDYDHPAQFVKAATLRDEQPTGGRLKIPETIVFNKLWLDGLLAKEGSILADKRTLDYVTRQDSAQKHRLKGRTAMDTLLWRAEGTMLHELFHLTAFGKLTHIPQMSLKSYGWANNVAGKETRNPELYALLGLAIKLTESGYKVDQEGMVTVRGTPP